MLLQIMRLAREFVIYQQRKECWQSKQRKQRWISMRRSHTWWKKLAWGKITVKRDPAKVARDVPYVVKGRIPCCCAGCSLFFRIAHKRRFKPSQELCFKEDDKWQCVVGIDDLRVCTKLQILSKTESRLWFYTFKKYKNGNSARRIST